MTRLSFNNTGAFSDPLLGDPAAVSEPMASPNTPAPVETPQRGPRRARGEHVATGPERSTPARLWYWFAQRMLATLFAALGTWRATGRHNLPATGGALLVANHLSFHDPFLLGIPLQRPLNFVARSTLFIPVIGLLLRSLGGFPIQREGMSASALKETLLRLRNGGIVALFPEGTRSRDGQLAPLKSGIAVLVSRAGVPVVPAGIAGTYEAWPRSQLLPTFKPMRIHYGPPIHPAELAGMDSQAITDLVRDRIKESMKLAQEGLAHDLNQKHTYV